MKFNNKINGLLLPNDFILFLKNSNIYNEYIYNLKKAQYRDFLSKDDLMMAFSWSNSREGVKFWIKHDLAWLLICNKD